MAKAKFAVGSNIPGYMPESEPHHATWEECKRCLIADLERAFDDDILAEDKEIAEEYENAIETAKALKRGEEFGQTITGWHYWLSRV